MTGRALRQVAVERLTLQEELANVVRGSATIVILVWVYLAATAGSRGDAGRALLPYQTLAQNRPSAEQRMFRALQEGLLEAEAVRSTTGTWPLPAALATDGIPPFAPDPTVKTGAYRWSQQQSGPFVNYLGIPERPGTPAWVVLIQEPEDGVPPDQNYEDEEHHRLLDGRMLHVSIWSHPSGAAAPERLTRVPQAEGWQQIYAVSPSTAKPLAIMPQ